MSTNHKSRLRIPTVRMQMEMDDLRKKMSALEAEHHPNRGRVAKAEGEAKELRALRVQVRRCRLNTSG